MTEFSDRQVGDLKVRIDRTLCVGFGECVTAAPGAFALDGEDIVVFVNPEALERASLVKACEACPVDALTVWDVTGRQIVP
jgi:ferredoxin